MCKRDGRTVAARHADHILGFHRADGTIDEKLRLDPGNLQSLCPSCHSRKTNQSGEIRSRAASPVRGTAPDGTPLDPAHPWSEGQ